ncbi:helix-turn-helix transcriptional regulator [Vibrio sp. CAU 1672]|uniref:response regulator transcription factor n=1 Tax=Vibrio sp. CAU 1672 TaxID=3032594 RepID=UPI0023DAD39C|nr:helix-turn-helix transcriptional regulator [Vibrio sp. CAU 1672]MDF2152953.1 helix-turn-helix transcriptional regulator [Vibrio sp. CAU 1672]
MPDSAFNTHLAKAISALNTPHFTPALMRVIESVLNYDCAVILGYREGKHPIYLYDSITSERELLFQRYLTTSFQNDPFYQRLRDCKQQGIFTLKDVAGKDLDYDAYCQQFYHQTGWKDELSMLIKIEPGRWVMLCFGDLQAGKRFSQQQTTKLRPYFPVIQSLCQQHWRPSEFVLSEPIVVPGKIPGNMHTAIKEGLNTFGRGLLTKREQEVASLLAQGFDSKEIAAQLNLVEGTVKNHRKRIYAQLKVASLGELFQLFLNHLISQAK